MLCKYNILNMVSKIKHRFRREVIRTFETERTNTNCNEIYLTKCLTTVKAHNGAALN